MTEQQAIRMALEYVESVPDDRYNADHIDRDALITALHQALANQALRQAIEQQPADEPCGWQFYQNGKWHNGMDTNNHRANTEASGFPVRDVYAQQPAAWVGLTDEEIDACINMSIQKTCRAIEAKLKEKNT